MGPHLFRAVPLHHDSRRELPTIFWAVVALLVASTGMILLVDFTNYDVWSSVLAYGALVCVTAPLIRHCAKVDNDPRLYAILMCALMLKLGMALPRYYMINVLYGGEGDSAIYHAGGVAFSNNIKAGHLTVDLGPYLRTQPDESRRIASLTGVMYLFVGPSIYSGFFIYSWFGFLGNLGLVRALRHGFPEADHRKYTLAVMFLPSLLFWPSAIGKDGWMLFMIGLISYGASRVLGPKMSAVGILPIALGALGAIWIRPHMGLIVLAPLVVGIVFRALKRGEKTATNRARSSVFKVVLLVGVAALLFFASSSVTARFGSGGLESVATGAERQSGVGKSSFEASPVRSPLDLPMATVSVLFRPFPWEAGNLNSLIAASEGLIIAGLFFKNRKGLRYVFQSAWRRPYLTFCMAYALAFIVAFSNIANAAILSRQRTQLMGLLLVFMALPPNRWWDSGETTGEQTRPSAEVLGLGDDRSETSGATERFSESPPMMTGLELGELPAHPSDTRVS